MTIQRASWGYIRNTDISGYLSITSLIAEIVTTVRFVCVFVRMYACVCVRITELAVSLSCGGNIVMNIGPTHDGRIMPIFKERFNQTGEHTHTHTHTCTHIL